MKPTRERPVDAARITAGKITATSIPEKDADRKPRRLICASKITAGRITETWERAR